MKEIGLRQSHFLLIQFNRTATLFEELVKHLFRRAICPGMALCRPPLEELLSGPKRLLLNCQKYESCRIKLKNAKTFSLMERWHNETNHNMQQALPTHKC